MAMTSAFSNFVLLFVSAHLTSVLNSPVPVVQTVSNVTLISGKEATVTCKYNRTVFAVYWRYESTPSQLKLLVALDKYYEEGKRSGAGYDEERFDITDDYSLIIHDVEAADEGKYICEVSDYETGKVFRNHTYVATIVIAKRPFVRIEQCEDDVSAADELSIPCVLHTTSGDPNVELTCTVLAAKPMVYLTWISSKPYDMSEYWKQVMNRSTFTEMGRGDGTFDQTSTVTFDTSLFRSDVHHFTCFAEGLAVDGTANQTVGVYLTHIKDINVTGRVVASVIATLAVTAVLIGITWKLKDKYWNNRHGNDDLFSSEERRKAIDRQNSDDSAQSLDSADGNLNDPKMKAKAISKRNKLFTSVQKVTSKSTTTPIFLGVFGDKEAGKSSFINSLASAVQGDSMHDMHEENETSLGDSMHEENEASFIESEKAPLTATHNSAWRYTKLISRGIGIREILDDKKFEPKRIPTVLRSTRTDLGQRPSSSSIPSAKGNSSPEDEDIKESDDLVHYPIFAFDISNRDDLSSRTKVLKHFSAAVHKHIMQYPMLVLTKATAEKDTNEDGIMQMLLRETGVPKDNILVTINYRDDGQEMDVCKQIELLDFLLDCVEKVNIQKKGLKKRSSKRK